MSMGGLQVLCADVISERGVRSLSELLFADLGSDRPWGGRLIWHSKSEILLSSCYRR